MELANVHLEELLRDLQEKVLGEGRAITRDKATERMRARIPEPQKKLEDTTTAKELKKKGWKYHKVAGPESSGDSFGDQGEDKHERED